MKFPSLKIFDNSLFRILFFIIVSLVLIYLGSFYTDWFSDNHFLLILLFVSLLTEFLRTDGKWFSLGLRIGDFVGNHFLLAFLPVVSFFGIFTVLSLLGGAELRANPTELTISIYLNSMWSIFVAAVIEELFFRGIIFQALIESFNKYFIAIAMALVFSLLHSFNPNVTYLAGFNIFLAGLLFGIMYIETKSLILPILFHFFWNVITSRVLGLRLSGLVPRDSLYYLNSEILQIGIFGGEFGPEGGILTTVFLMYMIFLTIKYTKEDKEVATIIKRRNLLK